MASDHTDPDPGAQGEPSGGERQAPPRESGAWTPQQRLVVELAQFIISQTDWELTGDAAAAGVRGIQKCLDHFVERQRGHGNIRHGR